jgi:GNS1/SUR4 family
MAVYIAILNAYVHACMYTYYFFSSFKYPAIQKVSKVVKPFITIIQLVQFVIILTQCVIAILPECGCGYFFHLQIVNFTLLTILFSHFFIKTYFKKKDPKGSYAIAQTSNIL